jgi:hypothetical protein
MDMGLDLVEEDQAVLGVGPDLVEEDQAVLVVVLVLGAAPLLLVVLVLGGIPIPHLLVDTLHRHFFV